MRWTNDLRVTMNSVPITSLFMTTLLFLCGCGHTEEMSSRVASRDNIPGYTKIVEGNWIGTIDQDTIFLTVLEGEFEGGPMLGGSAHITRGGHSTTYEIVNGTNNKKDTVWFSLYKINVKGRGDFNLKGHVDGTNIRGTFEQYNGAGTHIGNGRWDVHRLY
jgi:hypothetical protein